jgi:predicted transcriptional regulator
MVGGLGGLAQNAGLITKIIELLTTTPMAKTLLETLTQPKTSNELCSQLNLGTTDLNNLLGKLTSVKAIEQTGDQFNITDIASQALNQMK